MILNGLPWKQTEIILSFLRLHPITLPRVKPFFSAKWKNLVTNHWCSGYDLVLWPPWPGLNLSLKIISGPETPGIWKVKVNLWPCLHWGLRALTLALTFFLSLSSWLSRPTGPNLCLLTALCPGVAGEFPRPCRFKYCLGYRWHHPLGHGENAISGHFDHTEAQKHSLTLIVSVSFALHVSLLLIQQGLFLTSYLYALVGKDFLDIIPKPCPCSVKLSAVYVRQNCQMNSNFLLAARKLKQSILGSSAVILCLEIYHENSSACPPSNLKLHAVSPTAPNSNFSEISALHHLGPLHSRSWQPPHCYGQCIRLAATQKSEL